MGLQTSRSTSENISSRAEGQPVAVSAPIQETMEGAPSNLKAKVQASLAKAVEREAEKKLEEQRQKQSEIQKLKDWTSLVITHFTAYVQTNETSLLELLQKPMRGSSYILELEVPIKATVDQFRRSSSKMDISQILHFIRSRFSLELPLTIVCQEMLNRFTQELLGLSSKI